MNDDDENLLEQDEWLLDVLVHVLPLFVVAILFDDFETRSTILLRHASILLRSFVPTLTCASVIFKPFANCERSEDARYFCR